MKDEGLRNMIRLIIQIEAVPDGEGLHSMQIELTKEVTKPLASEQLFSAAYEHGYQHVRKQLLQAANKAGVRTT